MNSVKLKLTTTNNKCVFRFSSTPTDFNIVVVQKQLTACSLRKSCSFRKAKFWLTYLQQHEKKINSQLHWNASLKFAAFLVENKLTIFGGKMRRRRDSRDVRRPGLWTSLGGPCKGLASPHEFLFLLLKEEYQGRAREILHAKAPHCRRVKSSLALYNLSKRIERPLLISSNDWNKFHQKLILESRIQDCLRLPHVHGAIWWEIHSPLPLALRKAQTIREWERGLFLQTISWHNGSIAR